MEVIRILADYKDWFQKHSPKSLVRNCMKISTFIFTFSIIVVIGFTSCTSIQSKPNTMTTTASTSIYDISINNIDEQPTNLSAYKGKKILIVNVASECGYTPQYADLQKLQEQHSGKITVLGFPANNFGGQEPGSNKEIAKFCQKNFGVSFPMFEKISVKGSDKHPLFKWLSDKSLNGWNDQEPSWNFCKYLVDENGQLLKFFPSRVNPTSDEITSLL